MILIVLIILFVNTNQQNTISYQGPYGIFTNSSPYSDPVYRPIANLPQSPSIVNTTFFLFTRKNSLNGEIITWYLTGKNFMVNKNITFIIHGWTEDRFRGWINQMKNAILSVENTNVVVVDWSGGAKQEYVQAVANTEIAGADVAILINSYVSKAILSTSSVTIIGHSLGSHVAGFAGSRTYTKISRITGLDPAGPYFDGMSPLVRLDPTDALFVDIIHTDAQIFYPYSPGAGIESSCGHVDFWVNFYTVRSLDYSSFWRL
jgi:pancreatic triacylglycerol lipase